MTSDSTQNIGKIGENIACIFLERKGLTVLERNFARKSGEIDIIAQRGKILHFVEVKALSVSRENDSRETDIYYPEEQVHLTKLRKIECVAEQYMAENNYDGEAQIDVVAVWLNKAKKTAKCRLFMNVL